MNRRTAITNLTAITIGITFFPACSDNHSQASIALTNIRISAVQEKLLADIAATIIPLTDTPGAKELGAHLFVLKMVDDCYEKDIQQAFVKGLDEVEITAKRRLGGSFPERSLAEKKMLLEEIEKGTGYSADLVAFYKIMKQRTIQGFMTSKYVVRDIEHYELIPSVTYNGYYPLAKK